MKTPVYAWQFQSSSGPRFYETLQYSDGSLSCDCPGWTRRVERTCKHTRAVQIGTANGEAVQHGPLTGSVAPSAPVVAVATTTTVDTSFEREFS